MGGLCLMDFWSKRSDGIELSSYESRWKWQHVGAEWLLKHSYLIAWRWAGRYGKISCRHVWMRWCMLFPQCHCILCPQCHHLNGKTSLLVVCFAAFGASVCFCLHMLYECTVIDIFFKYTRSTSVWYFTVCGRAPACAALQLWWLTLESLTWNMLWKANTTAHWYT